MTNKQCLVRVATFPIRCGFGIGVARGAEHGDEYLGTTNLAAGRVDHHQRLAGVTGWPRAIDKQLLAGAVDLAHGVA